MSQITGKTEKIGDHKYTVHMLSPMVALDLLMDLGSMVGPSLGALVDAVAKGKQGGKVGLEMLLDADLSADFFSRAAGELFAHVDKGKVHVVVETLRKISEIDGKPLDPVFEAHFTGRLGELMRWLAFALRVQYSDFWTALADAKLGQGLSVVQA